jgi:hypothetical protein
MDSNFVSNALKYTGILIEGCLLVYMARSAQRRRLAGVGLYLFCLLAASQVRALICRGYGLRSQEYSYVYWTTDFVLVLASFLLVCYFFQRAFEHQDKMWHLARLLLGLVFVLVLGVSAISLLGNYDQLSNRYILEFNQNLYFTCLVLNTMLYLTLQHLESTDELLGLLVCGVGIQFAGPAATMALYHLTTGDSFAGSLVSFTVPICTLGMLVVWAYAIVRVRESTIKVTGRSIGEPALLEVTAD